MPDGRDDDISLDTLARLWRVRDLDHALASLDAGSILSSLADLEAKDRMRLRWDLAPPDPDRGSRLSWRDDERDLPILETAIRDGFARLSPTALASHALRAREHGEIFAMVRRHDPGDGLLVHLTHDAQALLQTGFLGTTDPEALRATFETPKTEPGYNFAFRGDGFDADNFGRDDFYGEEAIVFRAHGIVALNLDSGDEETVFLGRDVPTTSTAHLRRYEDGWSVLDVQGNPTGIRGTIGACVAWLDECDPALLRGVFGERAVAPVPVYG